jgi:hypothetical protein
MDFCLIFVPFGQYDEPEILRYAITSMCPKGADVRHKDYRSQGSERYKAMTLEIGEFIRRFLMHVLPKRFHRIRHYGLLANGNRAANIRLARQLLGQQPGAETPTETPEDEPFEDPETPPTSAQPCPHCGGPMIVIEVFEPGCQPKHRPTPQGIDSS